MMRKIRFTVLLAATFLLYPERPGAQPALPAAAEVIKQACSEAAAEKKNVFVLFHASWCGWCHKMDTAMNDPLVRKFFTEHYIIKHIVVYESKWKENQEHPGARELLQSYRGNDQGIPYWMVFDKNGVLLADSKYRPEGGTEPENNIGCPSNERDVNYFIRVLRATSSLKARQLAIIEKRFLANGRF